MHMELSSLSGEDLAEQKQADLPNKQYTRILTASYQALRSMYHARRHHRHPDWHILCDWIETLPYAAELIMVKPINPELKQAYSIIKELLQAMKNIHHADAEWQVQSITEDILTKYEKEYL